MGGQFVPAIVMPFYTAGNILEVARRVSGVDRSSLVIWMSHQRVTRLISALIGEGCCARTSLLAFPRYMARKRASSKSTWTVQANGTRP